MSFCQVSYLFFPFFQEIEDTWHKKLEASDGVLSTKLAEFETLVGAHRDDVTRTMHWLEQNATDEYKARQEADRRLTERLDTMQVKQ